MRWGISLAAKWVGIRVHAFSIGFPMPFVGKRFSNIIAKKWGETEYRIGWVPFGGYVQMEGQSDTPENSATPSRATPAITATKPIGRKPWFCWAASP